MARIPGVPVTGTIVPTDTTDIYAVIDPVYGIDGWRSVADHATRDAITALRTRQGMIVVTQNDNLAWQWSGSAWVQFGGGTGSVTSVTVAGAQGVAITGTVPITTTGTVTVGLGNITPTSVAATGTVTGSNLSGTNTGDQTITLTGDVTGSGTGTFATTIANGAINATQLGNGQVVYQKIQNMLASTLMGNPLTHPGSPQEITLGAGLAFSGLTLTATGTGGTVTSITAGSGLSGGTITTSGTIALSTIGNNSVLANISGGSAVPTSIAATALVDSAFGSARGSVLYRGSSSWAALPPGTDGQVLTTHGSSAGPTWSSTGGTVTSVATGPGLTGGPITSTGTISLAAIATGTVMANTSGISVAPVSTTLTGLIDNAIGGARGDILYRGDSAWSVLAPGTSGQFLATQGASADPQWATGGTGTVTSIATGAGLSGGPITGSGTIALSTIADADLLANISGGALAPSATTLTALIDYAIGSAQGDILYRSASGWSALAPGTAGQVLVTNGDSANPQWESSVVMVDRDGTPIGIEPILNLIDGAGITITAVDNPGAGTVDVTIEATGVSIATGDGLTGGPITSTGTISLAAIANHTVLANTSGSSNPPASTTLTALIDDAIGSTQGDVLYRSASAWSALAPGTSGQLLTSGGASANPSWTTVSPGTGTVTSIATNNGITGGTITGTGTIGLAAIPTLDLLANSTGGTAAPAGVSLSAYLDAAVGSSAGLLARIGSGAWSLLSPTSAQIIQGTSVSAGIVANTMSGDATITNAGVVTVSKIGGTSISVPVTAAQGGTGLATLTAHAVLLGEGTGNVAFATIGTAGRLLLDQGAGADPSFNAMSGDATISSGGVITVSKIGGTSITLPLPLSSLQSEPFVWLLGLGGNSLAVATDAADTYPVASFAGTFTRVDLSAKTGPVGAAIIIDILKSSNQGSTWATIWSNTAHRATIADGAKSGSATTFDTTTFSQGDWFRLDIIQVGSTTAGSGLYVKLV